MTTQRPLLTKSSIPDPEATPNLLTISGTSHVFSFLDPATNARKGVEVQWRAGRPDRFFERCEWLALCVDGALEKRLLSRSKSQSQGGGLQLRCAYDTRSQRRRRP